MQSPFLIAAMIAFGISELLIFRGDARSGGGARKDGKSRLAIFAALTLAFWGASLAGRQHVAMLPGDLRWWTIAGSMLILAGVAVRQWAFRTLGANFRTHVTILDEHRLVMSGPYAYVRHPSYTGGFISFLGFGLAMGSLLAIALMLVLPVIAFGYRIRVEEKALAERFGNRWADYSGRTSALIPNVW